MTDLLNKLLKYHAELDPSAFARKVMSAIELELRRRQIILSSCFGLGAIIVVGYLYLSVDVSLSVPFIGSNILWVSLSSLGVFVVALITFWIVSDPNELIS